jgi:hypothetical protein
MFRPFECVDALDGPDDLAAAAGTLRRRRYGVIEVIGGRLHAIHLRPFAKRVSWWQSHLLGRWIHDRRRGDRCLVFYNQPWRQPVFLALSYAVSSRDTTLASIRRALDVLDEIARLKGTLAIVGDVCNARISDRLLKRWGWEPHAPMRWHRNFIKRLD